MLFGFCSFIAPLTPLVIRIPPTDVHTHFVFVSRPHCRSLLEKPQNRRKKNNFCQNSFLFCTFMMAQYRKRIPANSMCHLFLKILFSCLALLVLCSNCEKLAKKIPKKRRILLDAITCDPCSNTESCLRKVLEWSIGA